MMEKSALKTSEAETIEVLKDRSIRGGKDEVAVALHPGEERGLRDRANQLGELEAATVRRAKQARDVCRGDGI
mgnify:CR=1 FL=1